MPFRLVIATTAFAAALLLSASPAHAQRPQIERGRTHETVDDDLIRDVCGIEAQVTIDERWSLTSYDDGSAVLHVQRTYVSSDPRIPLEKGAGTTFIAADGSRRVVGKPLHLIGEHEVLVDAGWIEFDADGEVTDQRGPHDGLTMDLEDLYCPD